MSPDDVQLPTPPDGPPHVPSVPVTTYEPEPHLILILEAASDSQVLTLGDRIATFLAEHYFDSIVEPILESGRMSRPTPFFRFLVRRRARLAHASMRMGPAARSWRAGRRGVSLRYSLLPVFPGAEQLVTTDPQRAATFGLHRFWQLTLPLHAEDAKHALGPRFNGIAYDFAYRLRDALGLAHVEVEPTDPGVTPLETPAPTTEPDPNDPVTRMTGGCFAADRDPTRNDWPLHRMNVVNTAGQRTPVGGATGAGIRIGHPDTGYTRHPELNFGAAGSASVDEPLAVTTLDETLEPGALEPVDRPGSFPFHGTGTATALVSSPVGGAADQVHGVAPGAVLVPVRTLNSVILVGGSRLARAIYYLTDVAQVDVISISLGGTAGWALQAAIGYANSRDVIIVCAAGNTYVQGQPGGIEIGSVVAPAVDRRTIAVAGTTFDDEPWRGSARGGAVDVGAPARCVWRGAWEGEPLHAVRGPSSGTSYAAPMVAGAAALWLETHGKQHLVGLLNGRAPLVELFRAHLKSTARRPPGWPPHSWGAGIVDVGALCNPSTLPDPATVEFEPWLNWAAEGWCETLVRMLDPIPRDVVERWLSDQGLDCDDIDIVGPELVDFLSASGDRWRAFVGWLTQVAGTIGQDVIDALRILACETADVVEAAIRAGARTAADVADAVEAAAQDAVATGRQAVEGVRQWLSDRLRGLWG